MSTLGHRVLPTSVRAITRRETRDGPEACRRYALGMGSILVVDDEPVVRDVLSRYLTREGYTVSEAADGEAGAQRRSAATRPRRWCST